MPQLNPIQRPSLTTSLADRYAKTTPLANVGSGNAQAAGSGAAPGMPGSTNMVDIPNSLQKNFTVNQPVQVTKYTDKSLEYGKTLGVDPTPYKG